MNKLILAGDRSDESVAEFKADTVGFLDRWEAAADDPLPPHPEGGRLTPEERTAFEAWDYAALYAMGAHPYLLFQFIRALYVPDRMTSDEFNAAYREAVADLGYPDYAT
jgi:hypothetical protein